MRPYLVLTAVVLMAVAAFGQQPVPRPGPCFYGCGPFVPLLTTPMVSLQTVSPNPVGASNATAGLIAGATNSTLSQIEGSTSAVYTGPVWYQGGDAPLTASQIHLWSERINREGHVMHDAMHGPTPLEPRQPQGRRPEVRSHEEHGKNQSEGRAEEARADWTYITGPATTAGGSKGASHVYSNDDVTRQNEKNGTVKHDGKTEKM